MKHVILPRSPTLCFLSAVFTIVLHVGMCTPAATSRGYPAIHPFWETIAPFIGYAAFTLFPFFDDRSQTLTRIRNVFVPAMCYFNGLVSFNLGSPTPRMGSHLGMAGLAIQALPAGLLFGLFFLIVAYPTMYAVEHCSVRVWSSVRAFPETDAGATVTRLRFSLPALLGLISLVALACAAGIYGHSAYENWPRHEWSEMCRRNLKQIALAMHAYHDDYGSFPPAYVTDDTGRPAHSWRVLLLPYLEPELSEMYDYSEPWDGVGNRRFIAKVPGVFSCRWDEGRSKGWTSYVVVTGPACIFDNTRAKRFGDILDGSSNTILVIERADSGITWTEPVDLSSTDIGQTSASSAIRCDHGGLRWTGAYVALADGSVRWLGEDVPLSTVQSLLSADGGETVENW